MSEAVPQPANVLAWEAPRHRDGCRARGAPRDRGRAGARSLFLAALLGVERSQVVAIENTSVTVVRSSLLGRVLIAVNDCHHLYDPVLAAAPPS